MRTVLKTAIASWTHPLNMMTLMMMMMIINYYYKIIILYTQVR